MTRHVLIYAGTGSGQNFNSDAFDAFDEVILIEPHPLFATALSRVVAGKDKFKVLGKALVADVDLNRLFAVTTPASWSSFNQHSGILEIYPNLKVTKHRTVSQIAVEELVKALDADQLTLKLDCCGGEIELIESFMQCIGEDRIAGFEVVLSQGLPEFHNSATKQELIDIFGIRCFELVNETTKSKRVKYGFVFSEVKKLRQGFDRKLKEVEVQLKKKTGEYTKYKATTKQELKNLDHQLTSTMKKEGDLQIQLKEKDQQLRELGTLLEDKDEQFRELGFQLEDKDKQFKELGLQLEDKDKQFEELGLQLEDKNKQIQELGLQLEDKDKQFEELGLQLETKDQQFEELGLQLEDKDKQIQELGLQLEGRDKQFEELGLQLETKDQQLLDLGTQLENKGEQLDDLSLNLSKVFKELEAETQEVDKLKLLLSDKELELEGKAKELSGEMQEIAKYKKEAQELKQRNNDLERNQQLLDSEVVKVEAQLELIKDVVLREKAF